MTSVETITGETYDVSRIAKVEYIPLSPFGTPFAVRVTVMVPPVGNHVTRMLLKLFDSFDDAEKYMRRLTLSPQESKNDRPSKLHIVR